MKVGKFERRTKDLRQIEILSGAVSALNKLLVDKKIISVEELQKYFSEWQKTHSAKQSRRSKKKKR